MNIEQLKNRDYTIIIDRSGSMSEKDCHGKSRWVAAQEGAFALASKLEEFDPDGLTVYTFANQFKRYDNVTAAKVKDVFAESEPNGGTALDVVLKDCLADVSKRKRAGQTKANGDLVVVITDGVPNDQDAVASLIVAHTKTMETDEELAIEFIQIGRDSAATKYLQFLDDGLMKNFGAKFDIVDTTTADDAENMTFTELLTKAITD